MNIVIEDILKINSLEIEQILQLNFFNSIALEMTDILILRQSKQKLSFLVTEAVILFLGILFLVPINLLIFQRWLLYSNQLQGFAIVIIGSAILSLGILLCFNFFLWQHAKKFKNIAIVLNKIEDYNRSIQNLQLITKLNTLSTVDCKNKHQSASEITTALKLTKDSLLKSLEIENFILENQQLKLQERYQLLNNLEDDLVRFMSLPNEQSNIEYQQLLTEAIQLGLSVHQEMRKHITQSS